MKVFYIGLISASLCGGCSERNYSATVHEAAGAERRDDSTRATVYGADHLPPRNFESSVLNEDVQGANHVRVNGSGYGFKRARNER